MAMGKGTVRHTIMGIDRGRPGGDHGAKVTMRVGKDRTMTVEDVQMDVVTPTVPTPRRAGKSLAMALAAGMIASEPMFRPTPAPTTVVIPPAPPPLPTVQRPMRQEMRTESDVLHGWRQPLGPRRPGPMKPKPKAYKGSKAAKKASRRRK